MLLFLFCPVVSLPVITRKALSFLKISGFYLLGGGGGGGGSFPPKVLLKKHLELFQIKIFFDGDFKESVKVTNVQKCDFSQFGTLYFQNFPGEHAPGPPRRPKKFFSRRPVGQIFFQDRLPSQTKDPR